jgi:hypothetical protein
MGIAWYLFIAGGRYCGGRKDIGTLLERQDQDTAGVAIRG